MESLLGDPALRAVWDALPEARLVGGAVRDALAGRPVADIDLATPRAPEAVVAALEAAGLRAIPTGIDHGTVTALSNGVGFEVTTLRRDVATDGRHATVAFTDDWREDAARRDFTFNAMSLDRAGRLFDPFDGRADLQAGRVRFVGDPSARIAEDYLRLLRFFRFLARYGAAPADAATLAALRAGVPGLARLSPERVWSELKRILAAPDPLGAVALMRELGVLEAVLPEAVVPGAVPPGAGDIAGLRALVAASAPADPLLRLAALVHGGTAGLASRLRLSTAEAARLERLTASDPVPDDDATDADLRRALAEWGPGDLRDRAWLAGRAGPLRARIAAMAAPVFPLQGRDLLAAGLPPGPAMGALLRDLRAWWLDGGCVADAVALRRELARRRGD